MRRVYCERDDDDASDDDRGRRGPRGADARPDGAARAGQRRGADHASSLPASIPVDAKTRAGKGAFARHRAFPAVLGNDFSGVVVEAPYEAHPSPAGHRGVRHGHGAAHRGRVRRVRVGHPRSAWCASPSALSHVEAAGRAARRTDRVGNGRRDGEGARGPADADPRRRRRSRSLRRAVRRVLRRARHRDVVAAQRELAARARRSRGHRLHRRAASSSRSPTSTSSST